VRRIEHHQPVEEMIVVTSGTRDPEVRLDCRDRGLEFDFGPDYAIQPEIEIFELKPEPAELLIRDPEFRGLNVLVLEKLLTGKAFPPDMLELLRAGVTLIQKTTFPFEDYTSVRIAFLLVQDVVRGYGAPESMV